MPRPLAPDVLVVGAGPAGTAAAITAAARGRSVVVVDKATFPRDKTCGDGLTTNALRLLERLGVPLDGVPGLQPAIQPVDQVVLATDRGRRVTLPLPRGGRYAAVVRRVDLDAALVAHARASGASVLEGVAVREVKQDDDSVTAILDDGTVVETPWLIAADGHYSTVRRLAWPDAPPATGEWYAFRQYFTGVTDRRLWVLFERDLLPGYAWVFPLPGKRANVGFGMLRGAGVHGKAIARTWRSLLERDSLRAVLGPDAVPESAHRAWPIPTAFDRARLAHGHVLFAGDAASVVDPMTGEGIAQALETGTLAAEAVVEGLDGDAYRRRVTAAIGRDLRFAATLQRILRHEAGTRAALWLVDRNDWTRRNFARWMFEDYPRALLLTPSRWRRGMLSGPGAYRGTDATA